MFLSINVKGEAKQVASFADKFNSTTPQEFLDFIKGNSNSHTMDHTAGVICGTLINDAHFSVTYKRSDNQNIFDVPFFDSMAKLFPECQFEMHYANALEESVGGVLYLKGEYVNHYQLIGKEKICDSLTKYIVHSKPYEHAAACEGLITLHSRKVERNSCQSYPSQTQCYLLEHYSLHLGDNNLKLQLLFDEVDAFYEGIPTDRVHGNKEYVLIEDCVRKDGCEINYRLWELLDEAPVEEYIKFIPLCWSLIYAS